MQDMKIGVLGAGGRMGTALVRCIDDWPGAELAAAAERPDHPEVGKSLADKTEIVMGNDPRAVFEICDAAIEWRLRTPVCS